MRGLDRPQRRDEKIALRHLPTGSGAYERRDSNLYVLGIREPDWYRPRSAGVPVLSNVVSIHLVCMEYAVSQPPSTPPAPPTTHPAKRTNIKSPIRFTIRNILLILAASLALGLAAAVVVVVFAINQSAYQAGHQPTPTAAARGLLYAMLNDRSTASSDKYLCDGPVHRQVHRLIGQVNDFATGDNSISYSYGINTPTMHGEDAATVTADVTARTTTSGSTIVQPTQTWTMSMRNDSGWKVCRLSIPS